MTKHSVCHSSYLKNYILYDCHLWYTFVKWWYLQVSCSFLQNFDFLGPQGGGRGGEGEVKGQKMVQNDKKLCLLWSISQEPYIMWLSFMVQKCKIIISPDGFFNFEIMIFQVVRGLKGQKMAQNENKFCLSHSVSQEPCIIWLRFLVHMCKIMISPANFFIFQNFDFGVFMGVKGQKMT